MHQRTLRIAASILVPIALLAPAVPTAADPEEDHDHSGPGSSGPDLHSKNVKLLANVAKSNAATQSDLAFWGKYAIAGNYAGFRIIDASDPENPVVVTDFPCNGAQGDVSVWRNLLFQSVDTPQTHGGCDSANTVAATQGMFEGIRIFDIANPLAPAHVASISTDCGSHTHTLYPDPANGRVIVYVSSYPLGLAAQGPDCQRAEDGGGHGFISIVNVDAILAGASPAAAEIGYYRPSGANTWSSYWYNGLVFTNDINRGVDVMLLSDRARGGEVRLPFSNPQTQMSMIG